MALAPIRGAPPGAPIPDFPIDNPKAEPPQSNPAPASVDQPTIPPARRPYAPIEIGGGGITLTLSVTPEQPAIARASMTIHVVVGSCTHGYLRMSAARARVFLTDLRSQHY